MNIDFTIVQEYLQKAWEIISPYIIDTGIWTVIGSALLMFGKNIVVSWMEKKNKQLDETIQNSNVNVQQLVDTTVKTTVGQAIDKIKALSFSQSLQPVLESELRKVTETANQYIKDQLKRVDEGYSKLLVVLSDLAAYFDNSIGVSDEAKERLHNAIRDAEIPSTTVDIKVIEDIAREVIEKALTGKIEAKTPDSEENKELPPQLTEEELAKSASNLNSTTVIMER